jgi:LmbE family N-acetylglucosaminyl deacetylase
MIEYGLPLRRDLARAIRRHRPEVLVLTNFRDSWESGMPNQADHVAVGRAAIDAARDAANRWVFPELTAEGLEPWQGIRMALAVGSPAARHGVDVTEYFDKGVESLKAHGAYLAALGEGPMSDPESFLDGFHGMTGERFGSQYAVPFELIVLG